MSVNLPPHTHTGSTISRLFEYEGVDQPGATHLTEILVKYPESYHKTMVEKELGLQMDVKTIQIPEALTMSVSYIVGSV